MSEQPAVTPPAVGMPRRRIDWRTALAGIAAAALGVLALMGRQTHPIQLCAGCGCRARWVIIRAQQSDWRMGRRPRHAVFLVQDPGTACQVENALRAPPEDGMGHLCGYHWEISAWTDATRCISTMLNDECPKSREDRAVLIPVALRFRLQARHFLFQAEAPTGTPISQVDSDLRRAGLQVIDWFGAWVEHPYGYFTVPDCRDDSLLRYWFWTSLPVTFISHPELYPCEEDSILVTFLPGVDSEAVAKAAWEVGAQVEAWSGPRPKVLAIIAETADATTVKRLVRESAPYLSAVRPLAGGLGHSLFRSPSELADIQSVDHPATQQVAPRPARTRSTRSP